MTGGPGAGPPAGPLAGLRVVEVAGIGPAPYAALVLAELGADVVRVDRPGAAAGFAAVPTGLNRSRPSVVVDLKDPRGAEVVARLAGAADVLVEGLRPGVMERLGLGPDALLARNPRLVYGRMTGWGQDGPWAARAGHDITYAAVSGVLHLAGSREQPRPPANLLADLGGGAMFLLVGVLAALHSRASTGRGQVVDAAMVDGAASLATMLHGMQAAGGWSDERGTNLLDGGVPFYDTYPCADGGFVAVGPLEPQFFGELLAVLGLDPGTAQWDPAGWPALRTTLAAAFATRTREEWAAAFEGTDACVAPVLTLGEAARHPHLLARGTFAEVDGRMTPRVAPRFSATPGLEPGREPVPGADTVAYLTSHGFDAAEVAALVADGVLHQA